MTGPCRTLHRQALPLQRRPLVPMRPLRVQTCVFACVSWYRRQPQQRRLPARERRQALRFPEPLDTPLIGEALQIAATADTLAAFQEPWPTLLGARLLEKIGGRS